MIGPTGILAFVIIAAALWVAIVYNRFVVMMNRAENGRTQIDIELRRRHDLVPMLVDTVRGYASHERAAFERVAEARSFVSKASSAAGRAAAENALGGAIDSMLLLAEAYPELKANDRFLRLQEELAGIEDRIGFSRMFYNDVVMKYNTALDTFPEIIVARAFGFEPAPFFDLERGTGRRENGSPPDLFRE